MIRYTIDWKAYPMGSDGIKELPRKGVVEIEVPRRLREDDLHDLAMVKIRQQDISLSSTPIFLRCTEQQAVAA